MGHGLLGHGNSLAEDDFEEDWCVVRDGEHVSRGIG